MKFRRNAFASGLVAVGLATAIVGCSTLSTTDAGAKATDSASVPAPTFNQQLHEQLPQRIREAGELKLAGIQFPPYAYYAEDGKTLQGLYVDVAAALETVLGINVNFSVAPSMGDVAAALKSGRYDASLSSLADLPTTEESFDFADWIREYVVFMVKKGNPKNITGISSTCGISIATIQGGPAEKVLQAHTQECTNIGQQPIDIKTFADQSSVILAVRSGRADAAFSQQIPLTYSVSLDPNFEIAGANQANGFPDNLYFGAFAQKGDPIVNVLLGAFESLKDQGLYDKWLKQYGIESNQLDQFGINLATANR